MQTCLGFHIQNVALIISVRGSVYGENPSRFYRMPLNARLFEISPRISISISDRFQEFLRGACLSVLRGVPDQIVGYI